MRKILLVDDKRSVRLMLREYLTEQGYEIVEAENGREALALFRKTAFDLVLLDIMMPELNGLQTLTLMRQQGDIPIIMLTAKRDEKDIVCGFELGADDYIVKPFLLRVLLMRIRAVLRRSSTTDATSSLIEIGQLHLDRSKRLVTVQGREVELTSLEYCLFERLVASSGSPISRADLCIHLMENNYTGSESTLKIHIRNLRQKIELNPSAPQYIHTVFGFGYRLQWKDA